MGVGIHYRVSTTILCEQAIKIQGTGFGCLYFTGLLAPLHLCVIIMTFVSILVVYLIDWKIV